LYCHKIIPQALTMIAMDVKGTIATAGSNAFVANPTEVFVSLQIFGVPHQPKTVKLHMRHHVSTARPIGVHTLQRAPTVGGAPRGGNIEWAPPSFESRRLFFFLEPASPESPSRGNCM